MDLRELLWLETEGRYCDRKASGRRNDPERIQVSSFYSISEVPDGSENAGSSLRRHERLAEAEYEV